MAMDYKRVVDAAVNAALNENRAEPETEHRKHGSAVRTVVAGAALAAVARVAVKKAPSLVPSLVHMPRLGDLSDRVRDRLDEAGWLGDDEDDDYDVEDEAEEDYEDDDEDDRRPSRRIDPAARPPRPPKRQKTKA